MVFALATVGGEGGVVRETGAMSGLTMGDGEVCREEKEGASGDSSIVLDLNLIDWSALNFLAVALDKTVYLWNYESREIIQLMQMEHPDDYISSVSWIKEGNYLAIGTSNAEVQVGVMSL